MPRPYSLFYYILLYTISVTWTISIKLQQPNNNIAFIVDSKVIGFHAAHLCIMYRLSARVFRSVTMATTLAQPDEPVLGERSSA